MTSVIEESAYVIQRAANVLITAGAGMGVDSGLPDFRGNQGFWRVYPALRGYPFEEMDNPRWFDEEPTRAWGFYGHRLNLYRRTVPHQGFQILKEWTQKRGHFVFTSNVDGSFQRAGFSESKIEECFFRRMYFSSEEYIFVTEEYIFLRIISFCVESFLK